LSVDGKKKLGREMYIKIGDFLTWICIELTSIFEHWIMKIRASTLKYLPHPFCLHPSYLPNLLSAFELVKVLTSPFDISVP
jgi:hypothetical protein